MLAAYTHIYLRFVRVCCVDADRTIKERSAIPTRPETQHIINHSYSESGGLIFWITAPQIHAHHIIPSAMPELVATKGISWQNAAKGTAFEKGKQKIKIAKQGIGSATRTTERTQTSTTTEERNSAQ